MEHDNKLNPKGSYIYKTTTSSRSVACIAPLLFFFLLFTAWHAQAQTDKKTQLQQLEQAVDLKNLSDEEAYQKYDDLMWDYCDEGDFEKALYYCREGISFARKKKNKEQEAKFLTSMGDLYAISRVADSVLIYLDKSLKLIEGEGYYEEEYANYEARGNFYFDSNNFEKAMEAYLKGMEANEKSKTQRLAKKQSIEKSLRAEVRLLGNISLVYQHLYNIDQTIEYQLRAIKLMDDNPDVNFKSAKYQTLGSLADLYMYIEQDEKAFPLLEESYKLAAADKNFSSMTYALMRFSTYYQNIGNLKRAVDYGQQALQMAEKINHPRLINSADINLMIMYFEQKNYKNSLYHAERVLERIDEDDRNDWTTGYNYMALNYAAMGNVEKAIEYMSKYSQVISKISDENMHNALQEMEVKYEVQEKELELIRKQAEINRQKMIRNIGLVIAILIIGFTTYIIYLRSRRNRALAEINAIKDKFFSIISHDLKNPALALRNGLQMLAEHIRQSGAETLSGYCQSLLKSANGMSDLLEHLLEWARLQTKNMVYTPIPFNLILALQPEINMVKSMAAQKNISFEALTPPSAVLTGDSNMLMSVIRNLLTNAVKFTAEGGTITLEIAQTAESRKQKAEGKENLTLFRSSALTISVSDTGVGMTETQIRNLFRLDKHNSTKGTANELGSGLGLIVCKEMLEKHGSTLHVESEEGKGCRFWFEV